MNINITFSTNSSQTMWKVCHVSQLFPVYINGTLYLFVYFDVLILSCCGCVALAAAAHRQSQ